MKQIAKKTLQFVARSCGFEVRRINRTSSIALNKTPLTHERTCEEYDKIWADTGVRDCYINDQREALYAAILDRADEAGFLAGERSIGDVGCGPGHLVKYIHDRCSPQKLVGFDFSAEVLKFARQLCPQAEFREHDIYEQLGEEFDLLLCTEVLEHLRYPRKALDTLLESATNVVLSVPNGRTDAYHGHINFWSLESWNVFLEPSESCWESQVKYACQDKNIVTTMWRRQ